MEDSIYDVVIVGMGPVGCTAAMLLAHEGHSVAAVECDSEVYKLPRAVNLDGEIVRAMQPLGLAAAINDLLQPVREGERVGFANSRREFLFGSDSAPFGPNGWQPGNMFDQPELEGFLRSTALAEDNVTPFVGYTAWNLVQDDAGVALDIEGADASQTIRGRYLLGCDGASSFVRKTLGSGWRDLGYNHDWLVVDVTALAGHTLDTTTLQVCDPDRICTYVCTKDPFRRWEFKLNPGETWQQMLEPEMIHSLIDPWTPRGTYEIRRSAMYQFHAATADTWRAGRVFIAGDAAHQSPPFLGQGMNAGMRDVVNLAWKLSLVLRGVTHADLLDSYQAERDAHAHDLVDWAVSIGRLMEHLAAVEGAQRDGVEPPAEPAALRSAGYGQGRGQPPLRAGVLLADQVSQEGATGYLFRQPIVRQTDGDSDVRLDDLLGASFALVGRTAADVELSDASAALLRRLGGRCVSLDSMTEVQGRFDRVFETATTVLVRPDRYLFGHTDATRNADDLVTELAAALHLST